MCQCAYTCDSFDLVWESELDGLSEAVMIEKDRADDASVGFKAIAASVQARLL